MMLHEEIQDAIRRLKICDRDSHHVMTAFMDGNSGVYHDCEKFKAALVDMLEQADPDTHMILPVDANGVPIHIGDELCGYGYPNGGVYCMAINGADVIFVASVGMSYKDMLLWSPKDCRHYHKPTVEDVLRDFVNRVMSYNEDEDDGDAIISDYAAKLREVMQDD